MSHLLNRRSVLQALAAGGAIAVLPVGLPQAGAAPNGGPYGFLEPPDALGLRLPKGFTSRLIAETGRPVAGTGFIWHQDPDGGATFPTNDGGWIYVSNAEVGDAQGGASMVRFNANGDIVDSRSILSGTYRNCSGGATPWGTWLSCEEVSVNGRVYECDPFGVRPAQVRPAMGAFGHEAAAVDPATSIVYMTEDQRDGGLYRFVPTVAQDLSSGRLEVMVEVGGAIGWETIPDPRGIPTETRFQVSSMKRFNRGEGAYFAGGRLVFATTGDDRVWSYTPATNVLGLIYNEATSPEPVLSGSDNLTIAEDVGDVFVCEDGGNLELVVVPVEGGANPFLRVVGQSDTELTGVAFDPSGTRLYFSSQRHPGRTYEITGPFRTSAPVPIPDPEPEPQPPAPQTPGGAFECTLANGVLFWEDQGANRYFVRSINGGVDSYLGETSGLSFQVPGTDEAYLVRYRDASGRLFDSVCSAGGAGGAFTCSLVGGLLSWTNQGASEYFVRSVNGGVDSFVASTSGLSLRVSGTDDSYIVRYRNGQGGVFDAVCPGNGAGQPEPDPDTVDPTGDVTTPAAGSTTPTGTINIQGTANDNQSGVDRVLVQVRRLTNPREYWNGTTWTTTPRWRTATLNGNGTWTLPGVNFDQTGDHQIVLNISDNAGNTAISAENPITTFTIN